MKKKYSLIIAGLVGTLFTANANADFDPAAFAKSLIPNSANVPFTSAFSSADAQYLQDNGCDPAVMNDLFQQYAKEAQITINNSRNAAIINKFANLSPSATNAAQNCGLSSVLGPANQIGEAASTIMSILGGNANWSALGKQAMNQMQNQACSYANNMASGVINQTGMGSVGSTIGAVKNLGAGTVQTPIGGISTPNLGGITSTLTQTPSTPQLPTTPSSSSSSGSLFAPKF